MKTKTVLLVFLFLLKVQFIKANNPNIEDPQINKIIEELAKEITTLRTIYIVQKQKVNNEIKAINHNLYSECSLETKIDLLLKKDQLKERLAFLELSEKSDIHKIRYLKGLSIIKILYEKVLSLDHHFSSVATFNEINIIANPNNYPEFIEVKDLIKKKSSRKKTFELSSLLGENIYTSTIDMFINLFNSNANPKEKKVELQKIECIMDFTLRMNNDLNTIYFETAFLQKSNDKVMRDLERLFKDYTKPIKYHTSIKDCRANDDWDNVRNNLRGFLEDLDTAIKEDKQQKVLKMQIDLNFPIDRLLQFITQYNNFIDQGGKFYEKFKIILNSYENQNQCQSSLPIGYKKLKADIDIAILKFNTAYKPVEINGSKMKEILYGINEYE